MKSSSKKIQTGLRLNRSRGEGDDYLQKFFGRNQCRVVDDGVALLEFSTP
jgi:hypothetical protein